MMALVPRARDRAGKFTRQLPDTRACAGCGKAFQPHKELHRFCSQECGRRYAISHTWAHHAKAAAAARAVLAGQPLTAAHRAKLSAAHTGKPLSQQHRASLVASKRGQPYHTRARGGRRPDLGGRYFRSAWEANYARYLAWACAQGLFRAWAYEPDTFWFEGIKRGTVAYTPDFRITKQDGAIFYVEIKGYMSARDHTIRRRMRKYHPAVTVLLLAGRDYARWARDWTWLPGWEGGTVR